MRAKLMSEAPAHYEMHDGERSFRVPKGGLSEAMHAKIRAMGAPQKMAGGGITGQIGTPVLAGSMATIGQPSMAGPLAALPLSNFSLPSIPGPGPENIPPAFQRPGQSFSGAELGLGGGYGPDAALELQQPEPGAIAPGLKTAPPAEQTLIQTGTKDGLPVVEERSGYIQKPIPGLRPKPPPEAAAAPPVPAKPGGGVGGVPRVPGGAGSAEFAQATREGLASADAQTQAEVAAARAKAEGLAEVGRVAERTALERKEVAERARQQTASAMTRVQAAQDEVSRIDTTVDPGRFWASRSTGDKVLGILGLVLGSIGAGNDGVNRAAGMLQQAIDRDLEAQKSEHEIRLKKGAMGVEGAKSFYTMAHQASQDDLAAMDLSRAMALDGAANKAAQLEAGTAEPMAKARLGAVRSALLAQAGEHKAKAQQSMFDNQIKAGTLAVQQQAASAKAGMPADQVKQVTEIEEREREIRQSGQRLTDLIKAYGTQEKLEPGVEAEMNQAINGMIIASAKMQDREGVVREPDEVRERKSLGFEPGFFQRGASAIKSIESYIANAERRRSNAYSARGLSLPGGR